MTEKRGSIGFFATHRPPVALDINSCPLAPTSNQNELHMTDGVPYNYNGQAIPPPALKTILKHTKLASEGDEIDVDSGSLSSMAFVSQRDNLETLHIALQFNDKAIPHVKVFDLAYDFGGDAFHGVRMEDSACFAAIIWSVSPPRRIQALLDNHGLLYTEPIL